MTFAMHFIVVDWLLELDEEYKLHAGCGHSALLSSSPPTVR